MIIAAAVRKGAKVYALPAPARHSDVLDCVAGASPNQDWPIDGEQGFIDHERGFVDRRQAAGIALEQHQILKLNWGPDLFSEDLW